MTARVWQGSEVAKEGDGTGGGRGAAKRDQEQSFVSDLLDSDGGEDSDGEKRPGNGEGPAPPASNEEFSGWAGDEDQHAEEVPSGTLDEEKYEPGSGWEATEPTGEGSDSGSEEGVDGSQDGVTETGEDGSSGEGDDLAPGSESLLAPPANGRRVHAAGGLVNGRRPSARLGGRRDAQPGKRRIAIVVILLMLSVVGLLSIAIAPLRGAQVTVDGDRADWNAVVSHRDAAGDAPGPADLRSYGAIHDRGSLYAFAEFADTGFGKAAAGSLYLLIDRDGKPATGYSFRGLGCELMASTVFSGGEPRASTLYEYQDLKDEGNWSGFVSRAGTAAALKDGFAELGVPLESKFADWRLALLVQVEGGARDHGDFNIAQDVASLLVRVEQSSPVLTGIGPVAARVVLKASGGDVDVESLGLSGTPVEPMTLPVKVLDGKESMIDVKLAAGAAAQSAVVVEVTSVGTSAAVTLLTEESRAVSYLQSAPGEVRVDGAFADWDLMPKTDDPGDLVKPSPRLDLKETRATNDTQLGGPAFMVTTAGTVMVGDPLPAKTFKPAPGPGGGAVVVPRLGGEDTLTLYVDVGPSPGTGMKIGGIGADHRIMVTGKDGRVDASKVSAWTGSAWDAGVDAKAESQGSSVEVAVRKADIDWGAGTEATTYAEIAGWDGSRDDSAGPRLVDPIILNSNGSIYVSSGGSYSNTGVPAPAGPPGTTYADLVGSGSTVYALRSDGVVYATADLGNTWTQVSTQCTGVPACPDDGTDDDFKVLATDGSGSFYAIQTTGEGYFCLSNCMVNGWRFGQGGSASAGMVYVDGTGASARLYGVVPAGGSKIRNTTTGGDNWDPIGTTYPLTGTRTGIGYYVNGSTPTFYVLSSIGELIVSTNNATTWSPVSPAPPAATYLEMSLDPVTGRIYMVTADGNTSFWQPGDVSWTTVSGPAGVSGGIVGIIYVDEMGAAGTASVAACAVLVLAVEVRRRRRPQG